MQIDPEVWDVRFVGESIDVRFDREPTFSKKPHCPDMFRWNGATLGIKQLITEWRDYQRRGRMSSNMRPENIVKASKRGSWGVGKYYFRVRVEDGRIFDIYYDRAPKGSTQRQGSWHLLRELIPRG